MFGVVARYMPFHHHADVLKEAIEKLIERRDIGMEDQIVVVSDILRNDKEIPVLEIVSVKDVM